MNHAVGGVIVSILTLAYNDLGPGLKGIIEEVDKGDKHPGTNCLMACNFSFSPSSPTWYVYIRAEKHMLPRNADVDLCNLSLAPRVSMCWKLCIYINFFDVKSRATRTVLHATPSQVWSLFVICVRVSIFMCVSVCMSTCMYTYI